MSNGGSDNRGGITMDSLITAAALAFGSKEPAARARCIIAEAEVALVSRELSWSATRSDAARATLAGNQLPAALTIFFRGSSLHATGSVAAHQVLDFGDGDSVEIARYRMFQAARSNGKFEDCCLSS